MHFVILISPSQTTLTTPSLRPDTTSTPPLPVGAASKVIEEELEFKRHALMLSEGKLAESDYAQISTEIASLESQIATLEQDAKTLTTTYQHANDELKKLKDAEKNVKKARETAMKDLESNMKKSAKTASQVTQHNPLVSIRSNKP